MDGDIDISSYRIITILFILETISRKRIYISSSYVTPFNDIKRRFLNLISPSNDFIIITKKNQIIMSAVRSQRPLKCRFCWVCFKYEQTLVDHIKRTHSDALTLMLYHKYLLNLRTVAAKLSSNKISKRSLEKASKSGLNKTASLASGGLSKEEAARISVIKHVSEIAWMLKVILTLILCPKLLLLCVILNSNKN